MAGIKILSRLPFRGRLAKSISTVFLMDNVAKLVGIAATLVLIRALPKQDYAQYTFFLSAAFFFSGIVSSGIDMAYVRFAAEEFSARKRMPVDLFMFSIALCVLLYSILCPAVFIYSESISRIMFKSPLYGKPICMGLLAAVGIFLVAMGTTYYQVQEKYVTAGIMASIYAAIKNKMYLTA